MAIGTVYSDALESQVGASNIQAAANLSRSKVVTAPFIWSCAAEVTATVINVAVIPKGARILSGALISSATLGGSSTLSVGLAGKDNNGNICDAKEAWSKTDGTAGTVGTVEADSGTCLKAAAALTTTLTSFLLTTALGFLYEAQKELYLTVSLAGTGPVGSTEVVRGYITYAID
jgi:hypothetical protein